MHGQAESGCRRPLSRGKGLRGDRRRGEFSVLTATAKSGLIRGTDSAPAGLLTGGRLISGGGRGRRGEVADSREAVKQARDRIGRSDIYLLHRLLRRASSRLWRRAAKAVASPALDRHDAPRRPTKEDTHDMTYRWLARLVLAVTLGLHRLSGAVAAPRTSRTRFISTSTTAASSSPCGPTWRPSTWRGSRS